MYLEHKSLLDQLSSLEEDEMEPPEKKFKYCDHDTVSIAHVLDSKIKKSTGLFDIVKSHM